MMFKKFLLLCVFLLLPHAGFAGTTYYLDINDPNCSDVGSGTISVPFCSISTALSALSAGDDLWIKEGTYTGPNNLGVNLSATSGDHTVIRNYPGHDVVLQGSTVNSGAWGIDNCDYLDVIGIEFKTAQRVLEVKGGSTYITFDKVKAHNSGIQVFHIKENSSYITIQNSWIYDSGNQSGYTNAEGLYIGTGSTGSQDNTHNVTLQNTVLYDIKEEAVDVKAGTYAVTIDGNRIYDSGVDLSSTAGAVELTESILGNQIWESDPAHVVKNNLIYDLTGGVGIMADTGCQIYNNIIWDTYSTNAAIYVRNNDSDSYTRQIYHNTMPNGGITVASGTVDIQNNLGYTDDTNCGGSDCNIASSDAYYVRTTEGSENYRLVAASAPINAGNNLSATVTTDIDGDARGTDIGADDYTATRKWAFTCAKSDVDTAMASASNGDTVHIPYCPAGVTWTAQPSWGSIEGIHIKGEGIGRTVLLDGTGATSMLFSVSTTGTATVEIEGITLDGNCTAKDSNIGYGTLSIGGTGVYNAHDIRIQEGTGRSLRLSGSGSGVLHNAIIRMDCSTCTQFISIQGLDAMWENDSTLGEAGAHYIEDSAILDTDHADNSCDTPDSYYGARYVYRYNYWSGTRWPGAHGWKGAVSGTPYNRGTTQIEFYGNVFDEWLRTTTNTRTLSFRGGFGVVFNNDWYGDNYSTVLNLGNYRSDDLNTSDGCCCFGDIGRHASSPFDQNLADTNGSGTVSTSGSGYITDSGKTWSTNEYSSPYAFYLYNDTDATGPWTITSNTGTRINHSGGDVFDPGDTYRITNGGYCLDQPGMGPDEDDDGSQDIKGWYEWNNNLNTSTDIDWTSTGIQGDQRETDHLNLPGIKNSDVQTGLDSGKPGTCSQYQGYWATDTSSLYKCGVSNDWTLYYQPLSYPHPLRSVGDSTPPVITIDNSNPTNIQLDSLSITGNATDAAGTIGACKFRFSSEPDGDNGTACTADDGTFDESNEDFTCSLSGFSSGANIIYVECDDNSDNWSTGNSIVVNFTATVIGVVISKMP